jgi:hypothetical protein
LSRFRISVCILLMLPPLLCVAKSNEEKEYEDTNRTSKVKNFGIGGWFYGKDCPGIELLWKFKRNSDTPTAFFRMRDGKVIKVGRGMAIFSPDCKYFWFTPFNGGKIKVYATVSGKLISTFTGYYPAWSPDSSKIYMSKMRRTYQLWSWTFRGGEKGPLLEVKNYYRCYPPGESVNWFPVEFDAKGNILWTIPVPFKPTERYGGANGKVFTIDPSSWRVIKHRPEEMPCE